jgi:glycosyltransferase involved in cell wall biosynthesis
LRDKQLREELGLNARRMAKERYSLSTVAEQLINIYTNLTIKKSAGQCT